MPKAARLSARKKAEIRRAKSVLNSPSSSRTQKNMARRVLAQYSATAVLDLVASDTQITPAPPDTTATALANSLQTLAIDDPEPTPDS